MFLRSVVLFFTLAFAAFASAAPNTLLVMGDSLSAAYGVNTETAWVALLRSRLDKASTDDWEVANASISGETTDGGLRRLPDLLERHQPSIVIIELGANDGLRGFPPTVTRNNLKAMIEQAQAIDSRVLLVGMQLPPNYGKRYTEAFAAIYPDLAESEDTALVPFFMDNIYNQPGMMQGDGLHPTEKAQPRLLENVWPHLEPLLED